MPQAEQHESRFADPLASGSIAVEPVWIRLAHRRYATCDRRHIDRWYQSFSRALALGPIDGVVVTGAAVDRLPLAEISYWPELLDIVTTAIDQETPTLGLCWGAVAVGAAMGLRKADYARKLFGVFPTRNLAPSDPTMAGTTEVFLCPHSRYAGVEEPQIREHQDAGTLRVLAESDETGPVVVATPSGSVVMHFGHPEYGPERLPQEYARDCASGLPNLAPPCNVDCDHPADDWQRHRETFFAGWAQLVAAAAPAPASQSSR
jgi:homoserine O-succinyltransferase